MSLMEVDAALDAAPTAVLERVAVLLDVFDGRGPLTLAEITRHAGIPRSSAHRLLEQLVALRWVSRQGNTYELGMRIFEIGSLVMHQHDVRKVALPFLHELHRATGLTVHFGVLDGEDVVYLDKIGGVPGTVLPSRIGARLPAHCTALGKAMLAYVSCLDLPTNLRSITPRSITAGATLHRHLQQVRERGIAIERDEAVLGVSCVAAPIRVMSGDTVAAVSVSGPTSSLRIEEVARLLRSAASSIGRVAVRPSAGALTPVSSAWGSR